MYDWLVVGTGFAGAVIAERIATIRGEKVLAIDRREHLGGNAHDHLNEDGILIHRYGPHIFHTNSCEVFNYLSNFTEWRPYEHRVRAMVRDRLVPFPINRRTINMVFGLALRNDSDVARFLSEKIIPIAKIKNSEDFILSQVGDELFDIFYRKYTLKQWGMEASQLDKSVAGRVPIRASADDRYFTDRYQFMPKDGFSLLFRRMLDHPNITICLGEAHHRILDRFSFRRIVYTGRIDEFFDFKFGRLPYRSLRFRHLTLNKFRHQPVAVVNYPQSKAYTRITEHKHLTGQHHPKTTITYEFPCDDGEPFYPIPTAKNASLYRRYQTLASRLNGVEFLGRLATYRYYNMDQVVGQALAAFRRINDASGRR